MNNVTVAYLLALKLAKYLNATKKSNGNAATAVTYTKANQLLKHVQHVYIHKLISNQEKTTID